MSDEKIRCVDACMPSLTLIAKQLESMFNTQKLQLTYKLRLADAVVRRVEGVEEKLRQVQKRNQYLLHI